MTIVAICPYCRAGRVRARQSDVGESAICPKCKTDFILIPEDAPPERNENPVPVGGSFPAGNAKAQPLFDEGNRSSKAEFERLKTSSLPEIEAVTPSTSHSTTSPNRDALLPLALGAIILFGPAVLATQFPNGRLIGLILSGLGLFGGLVGLAGVGKTRIAAAFSIILHSTLFLILLFLPSWLGFEPWLSKQPVAENSGVRSVPHDGGEPRDAKEPVDGTSASWLHGDVRVNVHGAFLGPLELVGPKGVKSQTRDSCLQISIRIENVGTDRRIELGGWMTGASQEGVQLLDPSGKAVKIKTLASGWSASRDAPAIDGLYPRKHADTLLIFEKPTSKIAGPYLLELSGAAVGVDSTIRFRLPATFLGVRP